MEPARKLSLRDGTVVLLLFAIALFASPLTLWWAALTPPWWVPYALWAGVIGATAWLVRVTGPHDL